MIDERGTPTCSCNGVPAPGVVCGHVVVSNKNLCGLRTNEYCEFRGFGCMECGAKTQSDALTKCNCGGDKDDCHGCHIWPDD